MALQNDIKNTKPYKSDTYTNQHQQILCFFTENYTFFIKMG